MNEKCVESIPYASAIGFILLLFSCGIFCGTLWEGCFRLSKVFEDQFYRITKWVYVRNIGVIFAALTLLLGVIVLCYGVVMTGRTRRKLLNGTNDSTDIKAKWNGAKIFGGILIGLCYVLVLGWLLMTIVGSCGLALWIITSSVCYHELGYWASVTTNKDDSQFTYSFNLTNYGLYSVTGPASRINTAGQMTQFCTEMSTIGPLFSVGFICSVLILIGLLTFICALASNLVRLKYLPELLMYTTAASVGDMVTMTTTHHPPSSIMGAGDYHPSPHNYPPPHPMEMQPLTASSNHLLNYPSNSLV